jgi:molybdopterin-guanine dinucleotide biosynthesis protein A
LLDEATLRTLLAARDPRKDATAFASRFDGLPEPLCAIWEPSSHALLAQRCAAGSPCPRKALLQSDIVLLPEPGAALDNVNTPEEFERMQRGMEPS